MIRKFAVAVAVMAAFAAGSLANAPRAQAQTLEQVQSVGEWAAQFQRIVSGFVVPLQTLRRYRACGSRAMPVIASPARTWRSPMRLNAIRWTA